MCAVSECERACLVTSLWIFFFFNRDGGEDSLLLFYECDTLLLLPPPFFLYVRFFFLKLFLIWGYFWALAADCPNAILVKFQFQTRELCLDICCWTLPHFWSSLFSHRIKKTWLYYFFFFFFFNSPHVAHSIHYFQHMIIFSMILWVHVFGRAFFCCHLNLTPVSFLLF